MTLDLINTRCLVNLHSMTQSKGVLIPSGIEHILLGYFTCQFIPKYSHREPFPFLLNPTQSHLGLVLVLPKLAPFNPRRVLSSLTSRHLISRIFNSSRSSTSGLTMAWRSHGTSNETLVQELWRNGLIKTERVRDAFLKVGTQTWLATIHVSPQALFHTFPLSYL